MITYLLRWSDRDTAVAAGQALGMTQAQEESPSTLKTSSKFSGMNIKVIGEYQYPDPTFVATADPVTLELTTPPLLDCPGWWIVVWFQSFDVEGTMAQLPESLRPDFVWHNNVGRDETPEDWPSTDEGPQIKVG